MCSFDRKSDGVAGADGRFRSLEGLRAVACIGVFLCHFKGAFYPDFFPDWLWRTPLKLLVAGEPFVRIFFVLSGFVTAYKYFSKKSFENLWLDVPKRYLRLTPMVLIADLFVYVLMRAGLLFNRQAAVLTRSEGFLGAFNTFTPDLGGCLWESFIGVQTGRSMNYIGPFWTVKYEFFGVLLVLSIIAVFRENRFRYVVYAAVLIFSSSYYNYFLIGMLAADLYTHTKVSELITRCGLLSTALLIVLLCVFGAMDIGTSKLWRIAYGAVAGAVVLLIAADRTSDKLLGSKPGVFLGGLSFGLYALHWPVIMSFSSFLYCIVQNRSRLFMASLLLASLIVTAALAYSAEKASKYLSWRSFMLLKKAESFFAKESAR